MPYDLDDTIAAVASAPGAAIRGIVRLSGPSVVQVLKDWFVPDAGETPLTTLRRPACVAGSLPLGPSPSGLPCEVYLWPTRRSYTRQPLAELHLPGSPPLLDLVLQHACTRGARLAEPGEFTLRAFLAGRLDLAQAEAVLGVIDAVGGNQFEQALTQLAGGLSGRLAEIRNELIDLVAHLEAGLDFVEEEDVQFISDQEIEQQLTAHLVELERLREQMQQRSVSGERLRVALVGRPNAGKSSLFNALVQGQQALVSAQAGTTRDYLTARLQLEGIPCELVDTPGSSQPFVPLDEHVTSRPESTTESEIDALAQRNAWQQRQAAQLELWCVDGSCPSLDLAEIWTFPTSPTQAQPVVVLTKCDLHQPLGDSEHAALVATSSKTGQGIEELRAQIAGVLGDRLPTGEWIPSTAARCGDALDQALASLRRALEAQDSALGEDLVAAELRLTLEGLSTMVGATYTDDILDRIFSRFCIGK